MAVRINDTLANKVLDCIFNSASGIGMLDSGIAEFRTGTQPASANTAASGTIVASITAPADALAAASGRAVAKNGTWEDTSADNSGTIGYVRFRDAADTWRLDADVSATGGGSPVTVDNPALTAGQDFLVTALSFTL